MSGWDNDAILTPQTTTAAPGYPSHPGPAHVPSTPGFGNDPLINAPYVWPQPPFFTRTMQEMCNHCWCVKGEAPGQFALDLRPTDHVKCCKCGDLMHEKFVP